MRCAGGPHWHVIVATLCMNPWSAAAAHTLAVKCSRWHGCSWVWASGAITLWHCCLRLPMHLQSPPAEVLDHTAEHSGAGGDS